MSGLIPQRYGVAWRKLRRRQWSLLRQEHLRKEPLCRRCNELGRVNGGSRKAPLVVDHIVPHRGDRALFFDPSNLQTLCKAHHDSVKQREEKRGVRVGADADGVPLDPSHPWRR